MTGQSEATLFLREAEAYLRGAKILRGAEAGLDDNPVNWENRNPMFFLLLHATELALKAIGLARGKEHEHSHDIVALASVVAQRSDLAHVREVYSSLRALGEQRVSERWNGRKGELAKAALELEIGEVRRRPVGMVVAFKTLGALGQSKLTKYEFGQKVGNWSHGARYPRFGVTSYPDFDACVLICEKIIEAARQALRR